MEQAGSASSARPAHQAKKRCRELVPEELLDDDLRLRIDRRRKHHHNALLITVHMPTLIHELDCMTSRKNVDGSR